MVVMARKTLNDRFWAKVNREGKTLHECWPWVAGKTRDGYGRFRIGGRNGSIVLAHRLAWELTFKASILKGIEACHNCPEGDRPDCCNPYHIWPGTHKQNMQDASRKGQMASGDRNAWSTSRERLVRSRARGDRHGSRTRPDAVPRGENHGRSKLDETAIRAILRRKEEGESNVSISRDYQVNHSTIARIANGRHWKHISNKCTRQGVGGAG